MKSKHPRPHPNLKIRLLGGFRLEYDGAPVNTINTPRLQSLLAYLALHLDAPVSRQKMAFLFWPDTTEAQARTNLRNLLHKLRSALPDSDRYLYIDQHTLQWQSPEDFTLDVDEFLSLARRSTSIQEIKAAVHIYSGDLLPECYDDWAQTPREDLRRTYLMALEKLVALLAENRLLHEAIQYTQILLRHDPVREQTYRDLMRLHAQLGDRAGVARIYKTCALVLERELDVKPSPATEEAYRKWTAHDTEASKPGNAEPSPRMTITHNLPAALTTFVGRGQEREQVTALLSRHRLVTLTGSGGVGKTRLAMAAITELISKYRDGVFLVDLARLHAPGMIVPAIADALHTSDEVRVSGLDGLTRYLSDQNLLLLLDNCEHLAHEAGSIALSLLNASPELVVLTTSRVALKVYGETVWQVPALPVPLLMETSEVESAVAWAQAWRDNESVELFIERAMSTLPTFAVKPETLYSIAEICRRLGGIPLAIEMAAARVKTMTVQQIVQRLDNALDLLKYSHESALPRHRTMEALLDWSCDLLSPAERELLTRLVVFSGDFSLQSAEKICSGGRIAEAEILGLLASLVDKSLVGTLSSQSETRFRIHEINRQYIHRKLQTQRELSHWYERYLDYFLGLAEEADPELRGSRQLEWLDRLDREQENLRAALAWALGEGSGNDDRHHAETAARLVRALWLFWFIRGRFGEGRHWAERALSSLERTNNASPILGKVLYTAASFCLFQGEHSRANELSQRSLTLCRGHADSFGEVISYHHLSMVAISRGDLVLANKHLQEGAELASRLGDLWLLSVLNVDLGELAKSNGDLKGAHERNQQSLNIARQCGDTFLTLYGLMNIAALALEQGDLQQTAILAEESLSLSRMLGERRGIANNLNLMGRIAMREGKYARAEELLKECLQIIWSTRDRENIIGYLVDLADVAARQDNLGFAARLLAACEAALAEFPTGFRLSNQEVFDGLVENLPKRLDSGAFTAAWTLGGLMSLGQAVSYALLGHSKDAPD